MNKKRSRALSKASSRKKAKKINYTLIKAPKPNIDGRVSIRRALTYSEIGTTLNAGAGTAATYVYSANGLYDPNISGVGHQPVGFDQFMACYVLYTVTKSTIKVTFCNAATVDQVVGLSIQSLTTTSSDPSVYIENQDCVWGVVEGTGLGGPSTKTLTLECDMRKQARTDIFNDSAYGGYVNSNPSIQKYFHLFVAAADGTSDPGAVTCIVQIDYEVYFRDNQLNALS